MLSYHNNPQLKQQILQQLQGSGWNVSIEEYETRFGIPMVLAHLEDAIFKGLPNDLAKAWPMRFMSAIQVGADLSTVWKEFAIWLLVDPVDGVIQYTQLGTEVYQAIMRVATLYRDGYTQKQMREASYAAYAAKAASYAAEAAAKAAYGAALTDYAAEAAAKAAVYAASAAINAAYAASAAVFSVYSDYATARNAAYIKMSNKLIELLQKQEVNHASLP